MVERVQAVALVHAGRTGLTKSNRYFLFCAPRPSMPKKLSMPLKLLVPLCLAALELPSKSYANRIVQSFFVQLSRNRGN
jgi:hypothetical protein